MYWSAIIYERPESVKKLVLKTAFVPTTLIEMLFGAKGCPTITARATPMPTSISKTIASILVFCGAKSRHQDRMLQFKLGHSRPEY